MADPINVSKHIGYAVVGERADGASAPKVVTYAVISEAEATVTKLTAFAVVDERFVSRPQVFAAT